MNDKNIRKRWFLVLSSARGTSELVGDYFIFLPTDRKNRSANILCFAQRLNKTCSCIKFDGSVGKPETILFFLRLNRYKSVLYFIYNVKIFIGIQKYIYWLTKETLHTFFANGSNRNVERYLLYWNKWIIATVLFASSINYSGLWLSLYAITSFA